MYKHFAGTAESGGENGVAPLENIPQINLPKLRREISCYTAKNFKLCRSFTIWGPVSTLALLIVLKP